MPQDFILTFLCIVRVYTRTIDQTRNEESRVGDIFINLIFLSPQSSVDCRSVDRTVFIVPWFAVGFIVVAGFNSLNLLPHTTVHAITTIDQFLLAMAMTALGLETHISKFIKAGIKPLLLALVLFAWLFFGGLAITHLITAII